MSSAPEKSSAAAVSGPGMVNAPVLRSTPRPPANAGTPWAKALTGKRPGEAEAESASTGQPPKVQRPAPGQAETAQDMAPAQTAESGPAAPAQDSPAPAPRQAATTPEIGPMTRASSVIPVPEYVANWMGPAPLGAVAGGAALVGLAVIGGGGKGSATPAADTSAPVLLSIANSADGSKLILTYSETLGSNTLDKAAFTVTADGATETVSTAARGTVNTKTVELTLASPIASLKTVQVSYSAPAAVLLGNVDASSAVKDAANNRAASFSAQAVTFVDTAAPTLASAAAYTSTEASTVVLTYSEPLLATQAPEASAYAVTVNNLSEPVSAVEIVGNRVYLTLQNKIASGTSNANIITLAYTSPASDAATTNPAVQDLSGNDAPAISTPLIINNHSFDLAPPTVLTAAIDATGKTITLVMSEPVDAQKLAPASAYRLQLSEGGSVRSVAVESTSVSGARVTLVLAEQLNSGVAGLQLSYTDPSAGGSGPAIQDLAGNNAANLVARPVLNNLDTEGPSLVLASFKDSKTLVLTFSEALAATTAAASAFGVTSVGAANAVTAVKVSGSTLELSLTNAVASGQATQVSYSAPASDRSSSNAAVQDSIGNDAAAITALTVDTTLPALVSVATGSLGNQIVLTFDNPLLASNYPAGSAFQVVGLQSGLVGVNAVAASGNQVLLTLASALLPTETVSLSYTAPAANISTSNLALQDLAGNDLASLGTPTPLAVPNKIAPVLVKPSLVNDGAAGLSKVVLEFNESFASSAPDASAFSVQLGGVAQALSSVALSASTVTLTLAAPLASTGSVTLAYNPPASNRLADSDGNPVAAFGAVNLGFVRSGSSEADTLTGAAGLDYFLGSLGNDTLTGGGGTDYFVWPALGNPAALSQTLTDFGLKGASGNLQGGNEADVLDLRQFLTGYSASARSEFLVFAKNADNKLVLNIDRNGGANFVADAALVLGNISVNSSNQLTVNGSLVSATANGLSGVLTLDNLLAQLESDNQLRVL